MNSRFSLCTILFSALVLAPSAFAAEDAPHTHVTPAAEFRGTSQAGTLGDYIQELDSHVGQIVSTLEELGLTDNTLLIFTSDNGGSPKDFRGTHGMNLNFASEAGDLRSKYRTAKADARKMGHLTNGPWHDGKGSPHEGGHRVPFIARWPGRIAAGSESGRVSCLTDLFATAADLLDADIPDDAAEDSFSMLPTLLGRPDSELGRVAIFVQGDTKDNAIAVCSGRWKMIESHGQAGGKVRELYDLQSDPGETTDVAQSHTDVVAELAAALNQARAEGRTRPKATRQQT